MTNMQELIGKRALLLIALCAILAVPIYAQSSEDISVTILSNPAGATVFMRGELEVAGVTPTTFFQPLAGYYVIEAHRIGYETFRSSVVFSGQESVTLDIDLVRKTRFKAAFRSLLVPGWGQVYSGGKTKGVLLTIGILAAGATTGVLHLDYDGKRDDYEEVLARFNATRKVAEREAMLDELYEAQKDAYDAEKSRNVGIGVVAGIWAYAVLDALVFFPDHGIRIAGANFGLRPEATGNSVKLMATLTF